MTSTTTIPEWAWPAGSSLHNLGPLTVRQERIREECLKAFYAEYVRSWLDEHPEMWRPSPESL